MLRAYDVKTVALAVDAPIKWVDNLLSHHPLPGVTRSRQGVERRVSDVGLLAIELVRLLGQLGIGVARAAQIVRDVLVAPAEGELRYETGSGVVLTFSAAAIKRRLHDRVIEAVDAVARVPRGRPRST